MHYPEIMRGDSEDLARFIEASALVRVCDDELMYNFGDVLAEKVIGSELLFRGP